MALLKRGEEGIRLKIELRRALQKEAEAKIEKEKKEVVITPEEHKKRLNFLSSCGLSLQVKEVNLA